MKTPVKTCIFLVAAICGSLAVKAQNKSTSAIAANDIFLSFGVDAGINTSGLKDTHKWDLGGNLEADFPISKQLFETINAGYNNFFLKDNPASTVPSAKDIHFFPAKIGVKYFPDSKWYIQGEVGAAFPTNRSETVFERSEVFIYAPHVGLKFPLKGKSFIDAGIRYEGSTNFTRNDGNSKISFWGLNISYAFAIGRWVPEMSD